MKTFMRCVAKKLIFLEKNAIFKIMEFLFPSENRMLSHCNRSLRVRFQEYKTFVGADENNNVGCINCKDCFDCYRCIDCVGCFGCIKCRGCVKCTSCKECTGCSKCILCTDTCSSIDCKKLFYVY